MLKACDEVFCLLPLARVNYNSLKQDLTIILISILVFEISLTKGITLNGKLISLVVLLGGLLVVSSPAALA